MARSQIHPFKQCIPHTYNYTDTDTHLLIALKPFGIFLFIEVFTDNSQTSNFIPHRSVWYAYTHFVSVRCTVHPLTFKRFSCFTFEMSSAFRNSFGQFETKSACILIRISEAFEFSSVFRISQPLYILHIVLHI